MKKEKSKILTALAALILFVLVEVMRAVSASEDAAQDASKAFYENASYADAVRQEYRYDGRLYVEVNGNVPFFEEEEFTEEPFETYAALDALGRCGTAYANVCTDIMPTEERGAIGSVRPTGWHTKKYSGLVDGGYLYNRCHLIAYSLAGENANEKNLITGTRYMNADGMLPFESEVADYVHETDHHVLYRVTPVFTGDNLVADGVLMEAYSVEDGGRGVQFCVFVFNVQPGVEIDYETGASWRADGGS